MIHLRTTVLLALAIVLAGCNGGGLHNEREAASDNGDAEWLGYSDGSDSLYLRILDGWDTTAGRYVHNSVGSSRRVEGYSVTLA